MTTSYSHRRHNLRALAVQRGGAAALAREVGLTKGRLSQMIGAKPIGEIGERIARRIEEQLGLPEGWLDSPLQDGALTTRVSAVEPPRNAGSCLRENLLSLMADQDLSQSELARRAGMAPRAVNRLLAPEDEAHSPTLETLQNLANGLGTSVAALLSVGLKVQSQVPARLPSSPSLAKQVGRLVEDFLLASDEDRRALLSAAAEAADKASIGRRNEA